MKSILAKTVFFLLLASCSKISYAPSRQGQTNAVIATPEKVVIYLKERPQKPFEEIGVLYITGRDKQTIKENLMKQEASKKGGNAIIDVQKNKVGMIATVVKIKD